MLVSFQFLNVVESELKFLR